MSESQAEPSGPARIVRWIPAREVVTEVGTGAVTRTVNHSGRTAGSLKNSPAMTISPEMFSHDTENKLRAVDSMRGGNWLLAFGFVCPRNLS